MKHSVDLKRRALMKVSVLGVPGFCMLGNVSAETAAAESHNPGKAWGRFANPEDAGFRSSALADVEQQLYGKPTTSFLVVKAGKIAYSYGDIAHVSYLASARKSVLSMLYGKYVANRTIDLDRSIGDLKISENGEGLLPIEQTATVRHLLMSSSGVYWPAGSPGGDEATPPRGSKTPGTYFHYNNWDFNVAGAIFERLTGKSVFRALHDDLALPLQLQDFDLARQRMLGYLSEPSRYKAYHLFLSARDMARLGLLMMNGGLWSGRQIVPAAWVKESTALHVKASETRTTLGYGYLWWKPSESRGSGAWADSFLANGNFGQFILGLPAIDTVIVHRRSVTDEFAIARNLGKTNESPAGGAFGPNEFLTLADMVLAARS